MKGAKKIPSGRTLQTRDEFLKDGKNTKKNHPNKKDLYRRMGVLESNNKGELALIKLSTKGRHSLKEYENGKSSYNAYIVIEDDKGQFIKIDGIKFVENSPKRDLSKNTIDEIKEVCLKDKKTSKSLRKENRAKLDKLMK